MLHLGIDIGGTFTDLVVLDARSADVVPGAHRALAAAMTNLVASYVGSDRLSGSFGTDGLRIMLSGTSIVRIFSSAALILASRSYASDDQARL